MSAKLLLLSPYYYNIQGRFCYGRFSFCALQYVESSSVQDMVQKWCENFNILSNSMTLCHWSADRGSDFVVRVTVHRDKFLVIKPNRCTNFSSLFWKETLHVSDSSSVHHQEYFTVHTEMVYVIQVCWQLRAAVSWIESNQQTRRHPYRVTNTSVA